MEHIRFALLGPVRAWRADTELDPGGPQERALLALLLARAGQPVAVSEIVDVLWGPRPPRSALNVIRRHVGSLRRLLEPELAPRAPGTWLPRAAGGYLLRADSTTSDLLSFRERYEESRRAEPRVAVQLLVGALALWQGAAAADLRPRARAHPAFTALEAERLCAARAAADTALRAGTPDHVLPALRRTAADHPLDEPVLARLILLLAATGHRAEALTAYDSARTRLADELGIDPGSELRAAWEVVRGETAISDGAGPRISGLATQQSPGAVAPHLAGAPTHDCFGAAAPYFAGAPTPHTAPPYLAGAPTPHTAPPYLAGAPTPHAAPPYLAGAPTPHAAPPYLAGAPTPHTAPPHLADTPTHHTPAASPPAGTPTPLSPAPPDPQAPGAQDLRSPATLNSQQSPAPSAAVPSQLPHALPAFTGRAAELADVRALLSGTDHNGDGSPVDPVHPVDPAGTVVIGVIGGMAGVGKTTLAVHCAHQLADRFPDGRLYVDLRGFDPSGAVTEPGEAVRGFLHALGVPPDRVPHGLDAQTALYRGLLAGRRVLILLDNARDTDHVRPLLPGTPGCLTLVTSRDDLAGLIAGHGARALTLRPFRVEEGREFLVSRLGAERVEAEPGAADEIVRRCAGLPLALACVAARAALHPAFPLGAIAAELRDADGSLDAFARSDASLDVGTVFSWSSRAVSPEAARVFRLLALHPGPHVTAPAAAALAALPPRRVRPLLAELAGVHLLNEPAPGRYAFHDLLRAHATELLHERHTEAERRAATSRLHHHYLHTAHTAGMLLAPHADQMSLPPLPEGATPEPLADDTRALDWLTAEYAVLLAVVDSAAASGDDRVACLLAWALEPFFDRRGHWHEGAAAQRTALDAALRLGEPALEARGLRGLARAEGRLGLHERSLPRLTRALELFTTLGDDIGRADTHRSLGWEAEQAGDLDGALRHNRLALDLFRAAGAHAAQASVLNSVGWYHALRGEYRDALRHCFEALTTLQELGDRYGQAATWDSIAYAHHHLGRHPHALLGYRNCLALLRELGVPYLEGVTLLRLGDTHLATGDHDGARTCWQQALALLARLGHPDAEQAAARLTGRSATASHDLRAERR
ncbi:AfsR/SARP family transcriptional regulator [Streptomyces sp. NPDC096205]|uniref:AfsR/SARP family transcriptional regulator n=1 Tax=Streptomyces sp. NPDC096205 TaxID=3366081 RepID=UPI0037FC2096